jgi:serine O-acetyltransferase
MVVDGVTVGAKSAHSGKTPDALVHPGNPGRKNGPFRTLKIQMGLACNMGCSYCLQTPHTEEKSSVADVADFLESLDSWWTPIADENLTIELWGGEPFLYFKGFHAIQTHRLAHWLWGNGERDFALYLQSRSSDVFQTDIHPAVPFGSGVFLDHATGLVVGETAVVEDNVSLLQGVTLGGTGKETRDRHPKIRRGAVIGAGAKILGNIEIGSYARIAAGSVVLRPVEAYSTVAGVPAKVIKIGQDAEPAQRMDQILSDLSYESFFYSI